MKGNHTLESRHRRSLSLGSFNRMQANWKYSKKEVKKMFDEYYKCIEEANKSENRMKEAITAVLALEGQRVDLKCPSCQRPDQDSVKAKLFWQRARNVDSTTMHVDPSAEGFKLKKDMTLVIKNVDVTDAGQYFCVKDGDSEVIYQVDVLFREPQRTVSEKNMETLLPAQKLIDHNLEVFTHWSDWGECDQCDKHGKRLKIGTCMVQKIDMDKPIVPVDIPIMSLYPRGVPCRSTVLSRPVAHLPGIKGRKSEVLDGICFVVCPSTPPPIQVTDKNGKVIEIIEGGYHPIDKRPELPPLVQRKVLYKATGTHVKLTCPTKQRGKVRWQRGERPINTATIRRQTRGRVFVDKLNRLHIRKLRIRDSAPYHCWVWQRHVGAFKLIGFKKMNDNLKHYITYAGLFLTIIAFPIYCACKLCLAKPKAKRRKR
ncbi:Ig-like V-type domain-containing protein FAM187A [Ruditapes philippinarum]|uniref:Ig-like V-type domain-containing protein FAM187A n=1 Tax=Ruditapes philippinarum TaxID=129788 RepID=UPI00295B34EE|nr:Ig-like V-type domain-containing protein FAM187A [Ruditapes philippinarum]